MSRKSCIAFLLLGTVFLLLCGTARAQEQPPSPTPTGGEAPAPGHIYLYLNGELVQVEREVTGGSQVVEFTALELLKGPTEEEKAAGYVTYIPEGVKLQYTTIKQDRSEYSVNLSRELLELSGDPEAAAAALAQIEKTLQDASGIESIGITVATDELGGQPEDAYAALGVARAGGEDSGAAGGGKAVLVIALVAGVALAGILVFLILYLPKRREANRSQPQARKKTRGKQHAARKKAKR
mgnify:CR=1 FL=1